MCTYDNNNIIHYNFKFLLFSLSLSSFLRLLPSSSSSSFCQIIPPHDKGISQCIHDNLTPWPTSWDTSLIHNNPLVTDPYSLVKDGYLSSIQRYCYRKEENPRSPVTCVYTAMHGIGYPFVKMAFEAFGLPEIVPVEKQVRERSGGRERRRGRRE